MFYIPQVTEYIQENFNIALTSTIALALILFWLCLRLANQYNWSILRGATVQLICCPIGLWIILLANKKIDVDKDKYFIMLDENRYYAYVFLVLSEHKDLDLFQRVEPRFETLEAGTYPYATFNKCIGSLYQKISVSFDPQLDHKSEVWTVSWYHRLDQDPSRWRSTDHWIKEIKKSRITKPEELGQTILPYLFPGLQAEVKTK